MEGEIIDIKPGLKQMICHLRSCTVDCLVFFSGSFGLMESLEPVVSTVVVATLQLLPLKGREGGEKHIR